MKRVKILVGLLFLATATVGCSDFLSEVPDNRTQIDTPKKVAELLVSAYPDATHGEFAEQMSDNTVDTGIINLTKTQSAQNYLWEVGTEESYDSSHRFWMETYSAIASANTALQALEGMEKEYANKPSQQGLKHLRAEALLTRAYNHFMLVSLWAKSYDPTTAENDMGIPYITSVEDKLLKEYKRNSVAEVYKLIEQDLLEGLQGIKGVSYDGAGVTKYHFNEVSAKAFAARFFLFKGDFAKVAEYSSNLGTVPSGKLRDVASRTGLDRVLNSKLYASSELDTNLLIQSAHSRRGRETGGDRYTYTSNYANREGGLFSASTNAVGGNWNYPNTQFSLNDRFYVHKFNELFKVTNFTSMIGQPYTNFVLFSNDMLFIDRLEAFIMLDRLDEALEMYNYLVLSRTILPKGKTPEDFMGIIEYSDIEALYPYKMDKFKTFNQISEKQSVMLAALVDMRRREGYQEGYRWFDIRRFNLEVKHNVVGGADVTLNKADVKYQLQIPQIAINRGITANPR